MAKTPMKPQLWTPRPVAETVAVYRDWAKDYDADVGARGYETPARIAQALVPHLPLDTPILDFGCGTGISGAALVRAGYHVIDGTDITDKMVEIAQTKDIYRKLWISEPGAVPATPGHYGAIVATGVISLGAAPPETLDLLIAALGPNALIALSFNDPTLADGSFDAVVDARISGGQLALVSRSHGPHLAEMEMGSDVIVLRRL